MAGVKITQLTGTHALPGQRFGDFSGKAESIADEQGGGYHPAHQRQRQRLDRKMNIRSRTVVGSGRSIGGRNLGRR